MKKVLIISPHFPPVNSPDLQRIRMSLPFYPAEGWEPVVLALGDRWQNGVREPELLHTFPPTVRVVTTRGLPQWLTRFFGVNNTGLRAWPFFFLRGAWLLATEKFDLVYFSNTQFATFPLGRLWRRCFGVPYVIDVQDPWRTDYYERWGAPPPPGGWKYQLARAQAWALEGWSFHRAAGLIAVSPFYLSDLGRRYGHLAALPREVIGFGASRADLVQAIAIAKPAFAPLRHPGEVHFVYTGAVGAVMQHALGLLFESLRRYRDHSPEGAQQLHFHFIGTSYAPAGAEKNSVLPLAATFGLADQIEETPHRLGHLQALRCQLSADVLILLGSDDPAYSPSKLYPYFLTGRPILALVPRGSVAAHLLDQLGGARTICFDRDTTATDVDQGIHRFFDIALSGFPTAAVPFRQTAYFEAHYLAEELTRQQCALFSRALALQLSVL